MPFYKTAYDTTAGQVMGLETKKLETAIKAGMITADQQDLPMGVRPVEAVRPWFILGNSNEEKEIPPFIHPYLIQNFKSQTYLVTDLRVFRGANQSYLSQAEFVKSIRNLSEYALAMNRSILGLLWLDESQRARIRAQFGFAGTVFGQMISQAVGRAYGLDLHDQVKLTTLGIYYYHLLFGAESRLEDMRREAAVVHIIKATKLSASDVYALIESLPDINSITDFCKVIPQTLGNIRLKDFNLTMLLTLVRNIWYGLHAKELIAAGLEHPPTWIAIVYATMTERSYRSSQLYKTIELAAKRGNGEEFRLNYQDLLVQRVVTETIEEPLVFRDFEE
jgi:hypothetical protein